MRINIPTRQREKKSPTPVMQLYKNQVRSCWGGPSQNQRFQRLGFSDCCLQTHRIIWVGKDFQGHHPLTDKAASWRRKELSSCVFQYFTASRQGSCIRTWVFMEDLVFEATSCIFPVSGGVILGRGAWIFSVSGCTCLCLVLLTKHLHRFQNLWFGYI